MKPEEKLAYKLLQRHNLIPPYDLKELVALYANVKFLKFPYDIEADGISLGLKQCEKPTIYINSLRPKNRQRFTLAHELGHVIIPWHIGNIVSHTEEIDSEFPSQNYEYREIESEANRFAAELLIPTAWLVQSLKKVNPHNFQETLLQIIEQSKTSRDTTLIKVFYNLSPGYVCAEVDDKKFVKSFASPDTQVHKIPLNTPYIDEPYPIYTDKINFTLGNKKYILWKFENNIEIPNEFDNRQWREILNIILEETNLQGQKQSINAILASVFQSNKQQLQKEIYSKIVYRYSKEYHLEKFFDHPLFNQYVLKRLKDLRTRHPVI